MSVSHCMHRALEISRAPRQAWAGFIDQLPDGCEQSDCGEPRSCRQRIADYLRVQYQAARLRQRLLAERSAKTKGAKR